MSKRPEVNHRSNEELARLLYQRDRTKPAEEKPQAAAHAPLASRREPFEAPQQWTLASAASELGPVSDRERRALFAALSKGTKANLGREPTVAELLMLVQEVDKARAVVSSSKEAIDGSLSAYLEQNRIVFRGSTQSAAHEQNAKRRSGAA
jgi:hypothetical protein